MLYVWESEAMRQYGQGTIIAYGDTVEAARKAVQADIEALRSDTRASVRASPSPSYDDEYSPGYHVSSWIPIDDDEDDRATWEAKLSLFLSDIAKEPKVYTSTVYVRGSD